MIAIFHDRIFNVSFTNYIDSISVTDDCKLAIDAYLWWGSMTVPRLKQLFLSWSQLGTEDRVQLDAKVANWCCPNRRQLYKPLQEALVRWETVQDTQGYLLSVQNSTLRFSHHFSQIWFMVLLHLLIRTLVYYE